MRGRKPCPAFTNEKGRGNFTEVKKFWTYGHTISLLLTTLLTAALLSACSSDDETTEQTVDILSRFNADGKAWMCLNIALPFGGSNTRAVTFEDGTIEEWAVKSLTLVLFSGSSEQDATVASSATYTLPDADGKDPTIEGPTPSSEAQITCTVQVTSQNIEGGDNVYLLVVLNSASSVATGSKLSNLQLNSIGNASSGFVMSNTPVSSKAGGSSDPTGATVSTLVQVSPSYFQASEELAKANPAQVFVERAAAKVTMTDGTTKKYILGNSAINFETADLYWALDNYNTKCYLTRQFSTGWLGYQASSKGYRMVEQSPLLTGGSLYRTYWGTDINYDDGTTANFTNYTDPSAVPWKAMTTSDYCAENTMDVAHMTDKNTTSVLVRLQLNGGNTFYTTSVTGSDVIFQVPGEGLTEEGTSASSSFARTRSTQLSGTQYVTISSYLRQWLMQYDDVREWVEKYAGGDARYIDFTLKSGDAGKAGAVTFEATQKAQTIAGSAGKDAWDALDVASLLLGITVTQYPQGYCYYRVPIKHFGDELTPWTSASTMDKKNTALVYPGADDAARNHAYLGRYGVVRNNWYTINIKSISHVGAPVIPVLTDYADDVVEQLLNAQIVVSKWTVHEQTISY